MNTVFGGDEGPDDRRSMTFLYRPTFMERIGCITWVSFFWSLAIGYGLYLFPLHIAETGFLIATAAYFTAALVARIVTRRCELDVVTP